MTATWKVDLYKADANLVASEISSIDNRTPRSIVDYAMNHPDSELSKCIEKDDKVAADKWRLHQARTIVCNLVYEDEKTHKPTDTRIFYNIVTEDEGSFYEESPIIVKHEDKYDSLLRRAYDELKSFVKRYKAISELSEVLSAISRLDI